MNSGDKLRKNALKIINKYITKYPELDFIFGSVKKHWGVWHGYKPEKINIVGVFIVVIQLAFI